MSWPVFLFRATSAGRRSLGNGLGQSLPAGLGGKKGDEQGDLSRLTPTPAILKFFTGQMGETRAQVSPFIR
jgi:hypothetical protein